jgi:hypothetical protein
MRWPWQRKKVDGESRFSGFASRGFVPRPEMLAWGAVWNVKVSMPSATNNTAYGMFEAGGLKDSSFHVLCKVYHSLLLASSSSNAVCWLFS